MHIFLGTDRNKRTYPYPTKPRWLPNIGEHQGDWSFPSECDPDAPPPGECREYHLVPVGEAEAKDARISEMEQQLSERDNQLTLARGDCEVYRKQMASANIRLENLALSNAPRTEAEQLAERSPGVMPQFVKEIIGELRESVANLSLSPGRLDSLCGELEACFAPPDGHEWRPVDDANPITAADVGRRVCRLNETVSVFGASSGWSTTSEVYILRPIAPPFVFAGEPGRYLADKSLIVDVCRVNGKLYAILIEQMKIFTLESDGSFAGVRITGRVSG